MKPKQLTPWTQKKSGKHYIYTVVASAIQLIKLSLSFSIYFKVFFYRAEG
jgi:hypothetical protein